MPQDIRQKGLAPLRGVNRRQEATSDDAALLQLRNRVRHGQSVTPLSYEGVAEPYHYEPGSTEAKFGESGYDAWTGTPIGSEESLQEQRHDNQSSWSVLGNGLAKLLETTGSTVAATLLGLPTGIYTAIDEGRWSGIWDNPVMDALSQFDNYMQENYKNYQDLQQQQNAENGQWWKNLGSFAAVTDQVSSLAGFVLGAAATGGGVGSVLGKLSTLIKAGTTAAKIAPIAAQGISALVSASGEAAIEANNNTRDWKELQYQKLEDDLNELYANDSRVQAIQQKYQTMAMQLQQRMQSDPNYQTNAQYYQRQAQQLEAAMANELSAIDAEKEQRRQAGRMQIDEDARRAGNRIMAANQVLLSLGNLVTLGKIFNKSYRSASEFEHLLNSESAQGLIKNQTKGMTTAQRAAAAGRGEAYTTRSAKEQMLRDWVLPPLSEGSEEMNQRFISSASGAYYQREDANDYWRAKLDPDSIKDVVDGSHEFGSALSQGFADSWGNPAAYEEFFYGALMGIGSSALSSGFGTNTMEEVREAEKATKALNEMIGADGYFQKLARLGVTLHYYGQQKEEALRNDDMKAWKDADDKEMAHIVETYYRAGKLGDLRKDIEDAGGELTDEQVQSIIDSVNLTPEQTKNVQAAPLRQEVEQLGSEITELERQLAALMEQPVQNESPAEPAAEQEEAQAAAGVTADDARTLDEEAGIGADVDSNWESTGGLPDDFLSEVSDEEKERERLANIERLKKEIAEKRARVEELNNRISGIKGVVSGAFTTNGIVDNYDQARDKIKHNARELIEKIDDYADSMGTVRQETKGKLNDETENELTYLHFMGKAARKRLKKIAEKWIADRLPDKIHLRWDEEDGSIEDLKKRLLPGVNVYVDNNTPDGSVTVDLSSIKTNANAMRYLNLVVNDFLGGMYRQSGKEENAESDKQKADDQLGFALAQLYDFAEENGLDPNELAATLLEERKDVIELSHDNAAYVYAYAEAMSNPDKLRKKAKKFKDRLKRKRKDSKESNAWDKATFEDYQSGRLDGIEPKTEEQKRKQRAFEKRAGVKRNLQKVLADSDIADADKDDISNLLDSFIDSVTDGNGDVDMDAVRRFLANPEEGITELLEQNGELLGMVTDDADNIDEETIKGVLIPKLADAISVLSNDIFEKFEESINEHGGIDVDDEQVDQGIHEPANPEPTERMLERQPTDVSPVDERELAAEEAARREAEVNPTPPTGSAGTSSDTSGTSSVADSSPALKNSWRLTTSETAYSNDEQGYSPHRPWFQLAKQQLKEKQKAADYDPNKRFQLTSFTASRTEAEWKRMITRSEVIWNYLKEKGVFTRLNNGEVKKDDQIYYGSDPELNKRVNDALGSTDEMVILLLDEQGHVLGDLADKYANSTVAPLHDELQSIYNSKPEDEKTKLVEFDRKAYHSKVGQRMIGHAAYAYEDKVEDDGTIVDGDKIETTINELAEKEHQKPIIGVGTNGKKLHSSGGSTVDDKVTDTVTPGQPYLVIKSNSEVHDGVMYTTAPLATTFDSTARPLIGLLKALLTRVVKADDSAFKGELASWCIFNNLLNAHNTNFTRTKSGGIMVTFKYNVTKNGADGKQTVEEVQFAEHIRHDDANFENDLDAVIAKIIEAGVGINVSGDWLSSDKFNKAVDSIKDYWNSEYGDIPTDYVDMLGSFVKTNVSSLSTCNEWFTVVPLKPVNGRFVMARTAPLEAPTDRQPKSRASKKSPAQLKKATDEKHKRMVNMLYTIRKAAVDGNNTTDAQISAFWNGLVNMFGTAFMRSQSGLNLWQAVTGKAIDKDFAMTDSMWNKLFIAYERHQARREAREQAQRTIGDIVHHTDVTVKEVNGEHVYVFPSLGKEFKGVTGRLLKSISDRLYEGVDRGNMARAGVRGTAVHKWIEMLDKNEDVGEVDQVALNSAVDTYLQFRVKLENNGYTVAYNEHTVTDGTAFATNIDLVMTDKDGNIVLGDIKTIAEAKTEEKRKLQMDYVISQLSISRYLFQLQNPGKKVSNTAVVAYVRNGKTEIKEVQLYDVSSVEARVARYRTEHNMEQPAKLKPEEAAKPAEKKEEPQPVSQEPKKIKSSYEDFVDQYGDDVSEDDFNAVFKDSTVYVDAEGMVHKDSDAYEMFYHDYMNGEVAEQPENSTELLSEDTEQNRLSQRLDLDKEVGWLERVLPQFSKEARLKLSDTLIQAGGNRVAYGMFKEGIISIYKYGAQGTVYHEAFHAVTQGLLTDKELLELYRAAREKYGDLPIVQLEEKLAEDFQKYMIEQEYYKGNKKEKSIFRRLLDMIKQLFEKKDVIDAIYNNISSGAYGDRVVHKSSNVFSSITNQQIAENRYKLANTVDANMQQIFDEQGITKTEFNEMTAAQKYAMKHCLG